MNHQKNEILPEENPAFYKIFFNKEGGVLRYRAYFEALAGERNFSLLGSLQYKDLDANPATLPKLFLLRDQDHIFKARICVTPDEASRIWKNINYALEKKVPVSAPAGLDGPIILLEYLKGEPIINLNENKLISIARIHSLMNQQVQLRHPKRFIEKMRDLANVSFQVLKESEEASKQYASFERNFPKSLIPVFDHQDLGLNNLIQTESGVFLVDEEALGILPFGYSLHRALNGRKFYSICGNDAERKAYLSAFSEKQRAYYERTKVFWEAFYRLRESARVFVGGNKDLSRRVLENGR